MHTPQILRNLTSHDVNLPGMIIRPYGIVARCVRQETAEPYAIRLANGQEVMVRTFRNTHVVDLPDPVDGVGYIVSLPVAQALPERRDLYTVDGLIKDGNRVIGARNLGQVPEPVGEDDITPPAYRAMWEWDQATDRGWIDVVDHPVAGMLNGILRPHWEGRLRQTLRRIMDVDPSCMTPAEYGGTSAASLTALYQQRNTFVVRALGEALNAGLPAYISEDPNGQDGYRTVIYINLPEGQVSWHLSDADVEYDGHTTAEKYARITAYLDGEV